MKPVRDDVLSAYRVMLGREPENDAVIAGHIQSAKTVVDLVRNIAGSSEFAKRVGHGSSSPFLHFNASIDVSGIVRAHLNPKRVPMPDHFVNFLGVAMPVKVMSQMADMGGKLDQVPIPANYHADMAEWAAALRAVTLARDRFVMLELGCGWACWMVNTGVVAKAKGLSIQIMGIEGDDEYIGYAHETLAVNGIAPTEYKLTHGIAAPGAGYALFPRREQESWGLEPLFNVSEEELESAMATGKFDRLRMVPLDELIGSHERVDLLHMDIQGGEATLVQESLPLLSRKVAYMVIGTHSRSIEGRLIDSLQAAGWELEVERPAIFNVAGGVLTTTVDGVQGWKNPRLH